MAPSHSLIMVIDNDHLNTVTSFVIDEEARFACGSDHALLQCEISVGEQPSLHWSFKEAIHYNITEDTDYTAYMNSLEEAIKVVPHREFSQMSTGKNAEQKRRVINSCNSSKSPNVKNYKYECINEITSNSIM